MTATLAPGFLENLTAHLPEHLAGRRWFRSKSRAIKEAVLEDHVLHSSKGAFYLLAVLRVVFQEGPAEIYFAPFRGEETKELPSGGFVVLSGKEKIALTDAFTDRGFNLWLAGLFEKSRTLKTEKGTIHFEGRPGTGVLSGLKDPKLLGVEQSNTSVIYDRRVILKVFRKLETGISPECEMLSFLNARGVDFVPSFLGEARYATGSGEVVSLGVVQNFIPNKGDGWKHALSRLGSLSGGPGPQAVSSGAGQEDPSRLFLEELELLGELTGRMHLALASDEKDPGFAPEAIGRADIEAWSRDYLDLVKVVLELLQRKLKGSGDASLREGLHEFIAAKERLKGFADSLNLFLRLSLKKTRYHGDFHLGQTLKTETGWVLFDFEGEPLRSLKDRKSKKSPLKDVGGMLRSLDYAVRMAAAKKSPESKSEPADARALREDWHRRARQVYLKGYFSSMTGQQAPFLSPMPDENRELLAFYEMEKAVYELHYELNNRPQWVSVPLEGALRLLKSG